MNTKSQTARAKEGHVAAARAKPRRILKCGTCGSGYLRLMNISAWATDGLRADIDHNGVAVMAIEDPDDEILVLSYFCVDCDAHSTIKLVSNDNGWTDIEFNGCEAVTPTWGEDS
jgi:hypothetical protein